jgi:hypothetical protein
MAVFSCIMVKRFGAKVMLAYLQGLVQEEKEAHIASIRDKIYQGQEDAAEEKEDAANPESSATSLMEVRRRARTQTHTRTLAVLPCSMCCRVYT